MEVPNFDLQFDFGFESDEENQVTSIGRKRQPDSDTETASLPKRRRLSMKPGYRNKSKELSETAKKFYSVESGESSDSEVEDANTSQNVERIATPLRVKRKVRRRRNNLELEAKARLFHSIIGEVKYLHNANI